MLYSHNFTNVPILAVMACKFVVSAYIVSLSYMFVKMIFYNGVVINGALWDDLDQIFQIFNH